MNDLKRNGEGYSDPTAYAAFRSLNHEEQRFCKVLKMIFQLCDIAGFELSGRITLVDKRSGKVWK